MFEAGTQDSRLSARLREVALVFLKLGAFSYGGPAVYIALLHQETARRRRWIDEQRFLDLVGATNLIPGPNATEMAIPLGLIRAGWTGLVAGGVLFILPGVAATLFVAWAFTTWGSMPEVGWVLCGVKPVVIAFVIDALWGLGKKALKGIPTAVVGIGVVTLYVLGFNEIALLFGGAAVILLVYGVRRFVRGGLLAIAPIPVPFFLASPAVSAGAVPFNSSRLFFSFRKIGSVLFGSGYVLLAFLRSEFVERLGWLTGEQVLDAVIAGQITPGPVFSSATFVGYLLGGWPAALLATLGIFLPSFLFVGLLSRILPLVRKSPWAGAFLDEVNIASLGLMAGAAVQLGQAAIVDAFTIVLLLAALLAIFRLKISSLWLIPGGAALGVIYRLAMGRPR